MVSWYFETNRTEESTKAEFQNRIISCWQAKINNYEALLFASEERPIYDLFACLSHHNIIKYLYHNIYLDKETFDHHIKIQLSKLEFIAMDY